jgi:hypothetical protein
MSSPAKTLEIGQEYPAPGEAEAIAMPLIVN